MSQLLIGLSSMRPKAVAASKSATASAVRPPRRSRKNQASRRCGGRMCGRRNANTRPRATAMGAGSSFVAVSSVAVSSCGSRRRSSARNAWSALRGASSGGIDTHGAPLYVRRTLAAWNLLLRRV
eukprot:scaffold11314_cov58-Phaeocystis_antarctica.AAC.1